MWRESASLILAAKSNFSPFKFNYKLLCLQRSSDSKVLANRYVFPGGNLSKSDSSNLWIKLFEKFGYNLESFKQMYPIKNIPPIMQEESPDCLPKYLSLRICAIRETFEECGILICKSGKMGHRETLSDWASCIGGNDIREWQNKVHDDPHQFLKLCTELEIYPDLWSLYNWSNWMTPRDISFRFNTMFFITLCNQIPSAHPEVKEIQGIKWASPKDYIEECQSGKLTLPVPQFYEISRIRNFYDINSLCRHAKERSCYGCEKYFPFKINTKEGTYCIFPGDSLYQQEPDNNTDITDLQEIPQGYIQNRLLLKGQNIVKLIVRNVSPKDRHLPPKT